MYMNRVEYATYLANWQACTNTFHDAWVAFDSHTPLAMICCSQCENLASFLYYRLLAVRSGNFKLIKRVYQFCLQCQLHKFGIFWNLHQPIGVLSPRLTRSDLKKLNYFSFSSFFGDLCLKVFGKLLKQSNRTKPKRIRTKSQS